MEKQHKHHADLQKQLEDALPKFVTRKDISMRLGGLYSSGYMANLDSRGEGPEGRCQIGKKIVYERAKFIDWLLARVKTETVKAIAPTA